MKIWQSLTPKYRRYAVVAGAALIFAGGVALMPNGDKRERSAKEEPTVRAILTDKNGDHGDARFERVMAQLESIRDDKKEFNKEIERLRRDMQRLEVGEIGTSLSKELQELQRRLDSIEKDVDLVAPSTKKGSSNVVLGGSAEAAEPTAGAEGEPVAPIVPVIPEPAQPVAQQMWHESTPSQPVMDSGENTAAPVAQSQIRVIEAPVKEMTAEEKAALEKDNSIYIPAGSIITGTLITGMDAPTGKQARQDPHPALLRIKYEAILPNRFRADVRECFALLGGYGDLSSERAYLRGETISCVRKDGQIVESSLESFTVGEDGKAGVRGRLVSKQGQMLSKALTAGVIEGFAEAFDRVPVPSLSLQDDTGRQLYQQAFSTDSMQSGAVAGIGGALDRLAQYYIDQAESMFPVIEIDAGREVEIVLVRGGKLALK